MLTRISVCATFENTSLHNGSLKHTDFSHSVFYAQDDLHLISFAGCDLQNASFQDADIVGASFDRTNLSGAIFSGASSLLKKVYVSNIESRTEPESHDR